MTPMKDDDFIEEMDADESAIGDADLEYDEDEEMIISDEIEVEEDVLPSVLMTGISRPKTDEEWYELLRNATREGLPEGVPEYAITNSYEEGGLIVHPLFGPGVVAKVKTSRKMEVIFHNRETGEMVKKLMAMNIELDAVQKRDGERR